MKTKTPHEATRAEIAEARSGTSTEAGLDRRSFIRNSAVFGLTTAVGAGLLENTPSAQGANTASGSLTTGDAALLRFAAAAEILETDFWVQYNELGGVQDGEFPGAGGTGNSA